MRIRKIMALAAALTVSASLLMGCGGTSSSSSTTAAQAAATKAAAAQTSAVQKTTAAQKSSAAQKSGASTSEFPGGKGITIYVASEAGGMSDLGIRLLVPYLEKEFGTTFTVVNEKGGSGWICWLNHMHDKADGLSWIQVNDTMDYQGLNPQTPHKESSRDFQLLGCQVIDISALSCRTDETRWTDLKSLVEYAKNNEVTVSVSGLGTEDANVIYMMNSKLGTKFTIVVAADGSAAGIADVVGGHVDLYSNNIASTNSQVHENKLKALCVFNADRSALWPDVPTFKEVTGIELSTHSARGIMMPKGGDPATVERIVAGIKNCTENPGYVEDMKKSALEVKYLDPDGFQKLFDQSKADVEAIAGDLKWK